MTSLGSRFFFFSQNVRKDLHLSLQ